VPPLAATSSFGRSTDDLTVAEDSSCLDEAVALAPQPGTRWKLPAIISPSQN